MSNYLGLTSKRKGFENKVWREGGPQLWIVANYGFLREADLAENQKSFLLCPPLLLLFRGGAEGGSSHSRRCQPNPTRSHSTILL